LGLNFQRAVARAGGASCFEGRGELLAAATTALLTGTLRALPDRFHANLDRGDRGQQDRGTS
jgi:hypothetical protein